MVFEFKQQDFGCLNSNNQIWDVGILTTRFGMLEFKQQDQQDLMCLNSNNKIWDV